MNTASRLQSAAEPGGVLVGEPTWRAGARRSRRRARRAAARQGQGRAGAGLARAFGSSGVGAQRDAVHRAATATCGCSRRRWGTRSNARRARSSPSWPRPGWASRGWPLHSRPRSGSGRRCSSDRHPPTVRASPSPRSSSCSHRRRQSPRQTPAPWRWRSARCWRHSRTRHSVGDRLAQFLGVGDALGADTAWAVRRLLEVLASERPLVVILDDLHWAEPPMLDLADAVVERVHGPVLFVCLATPELLEQRPTWAAGKPRAIHDDAAAPLARRLPEGRRVAARRGRPGGARRPCLRDGRGEPAVPGAADGDARGSRAPRRRPLARCG